VPHHLVGFLDPRERDSAARFVTGAIAAIDDIHARGKRALIVGGTGFYLRALTGGVQLSAAYDPALRDRLAHEARLHPADVLADWLRAVAPSRAATLAPSDPYRITRALEIALTERDPDRRRSETSAVDATPSLQSRGIVWRKLYLEIAHDALARRIAVRVDAMLNAGLVDEAERIGGDATAADAVGYREALAFLAGWSTHDELRAQLIRNTRRYAKRQATWFRVEPDLVRIPADRTLDAAAELAGALPGWA
jgi:tRNA dimethylallyltransferase